MQILNEIYSYIVSHAYWSDNLKVMLYLTKAARSYQQQSAASQFSIPWKPLFNGESLIFYQIYSMHRDLDRSLCTMLHRHNFRPYYISIINGHNANLTTRTGEKDVSDS